MYLVSDFSATKVTALSTPTDFMGSGAEIVS